MNLALKKAGMWNSEALNIVYVFDAAKSKAAMA